MIWLTHAGIALYLVSQNYLAYFGNSFWAEDGIHFFKDAFERGSGSLFLPIGGYQNLIPRLIAWAATGFPIEWAPKIYAFVSLGTAVYILGYFSRGSFRHWVKADWIRSLFCGFLVFAPTALELTQALCNLHFLFCWYGALRLIEEKNRSLSANTLTWGLLALSAPECIVLFPLIVLRAYSRKDWQQLVPLLPIALVALMNSYVLARSVGGYRMDLSVLPSLPTIFLQRLLAHLLPLPLLGPEWGSRFLKQPDWIFFSVGIVSLLLVYQLVLRKADRTAAFTACALWISGAVSLTVIRLGRPDTFHEFSRLTGETLWFSRYGFYPLLSTFLAWVLLSSNPVAKGVTIVMAMQLACAFVPHPRRTQQPWEYVTPSLRKIALEKSGTVPSIHVDPGGELVFSITKGINGSENWHSH